MFARTSGGVHPASGWLHQAGPPVPRSLSVWSRRVTTALAVTVGASALLPMALPLSADVAGGPVGTTVIAGVDRYDTARLAALSAFPTGATTAVVASGQNFPDGLAAAALAGALNAPLLLTPSASLDADTTLAL